MLLSRNKIAVRDIEDYIAISLALSAAGFDKKIGGMTLPRIRPLTLLFAVLLFWPPSVPGKDLVLVSLHVPAQPRQNGENRGTAIVALCKNIAEAIYSGSTARCCWRDSRIPIEQKDSWGIRQLLCTFSGTLILLTRGSMVRRGGTLPSLSHKPFPTHLHLEEQTVCCFGSGRSSLRALL